MYEISVRPYGKTADRRAVKELYVSAFPKEEQMPWWLLRLLGMQRPVELNAYYAGETFCGFTYSVTTEKMLFLMFFAVRADLRGEGYGSAILSFLKEHYAEKTILLNVELLDETAENYADRVRRFRFYERNGFYDTGYNIDEVGGTFRVLATTPEIDTVAYRKVFEKISLGLWRPKIEKIGANEGDLI